MDGSNPSDSDGQEAPEVKPGETIAPGQTKPAEQTPSAPAQPAQPAPPELPTPQPAPASENPAPEQTAPPAEDTAEEAAFTGGTSQLSNDSISWTASEFIAHNKSAGWYIAFGLAAILVAAVTYLLTRDVVSAVVIIIVGAALASFGARKPRQLQYALDGQGLKVGDRYFPLDSFRSFAVSDEGAFSGIIFRPLKRFGQLITIYVDPADEEKIVDILSNRLPFDQKSTDAVDQFMKRIRF